MSIIMGKEEIYNHCMKGCISVMENVNIVNAPNEFKESAVPIFCFLFAGVVLIYCMLVYLYEIYSIKKENKKLKQNMKAVKKLKPILKIMSRSGLNERQKSQIDQFLI